MFDFPFGCRGVAKCHAIALSEGALPDAGARFGPALAFDDGAAKYHEVVIRHFDGGPTTDLLLAVKDALKPAEMAQLVRELEASVVDDVPLRVLSLTPGWFTRASSASEVRVALAGRRP